MAQRKQRVKVVNPFYQRGSTKPIGIESVIDLDASEAFELRSANKVEFVQSDTELKASDKLRPRTDAAGAAATAAGVETDDGKQPAKTADGKSAKK